MTILFIYKIVSNFYARHCQLKRVWFANERLPTRRLAEVEVHSNIVSNTFIKQ